MVRGKYNSSKSGKLQGILFVLWITCMPFCKVDVTFQFLSVIMNNFLTECVVQILSTGVRGCQGKQSFGANPGA